MTATAARRTVPGLGAMARAGERIAMLTCYDASFATLLERAGVDVLLVGDSLGMVIGGHASTLPVTLDEMAYHTRAVAAGASTALVIADMPFGTYQPSAATAYANAARLMAAGAQMVKVEGGAWVAPTVEFLTARGIPVCGHLGLQPQSVHRYGGYKAQGRTDESAHDRAIIPEPQPPSGSWLRMRAGRRNTEASKIRVIGMAYAASTIEELLSALGLSHRVDAFRGIMRGKSGRYNRG